MTIPEDADDWSSRDLPVLRAVISLCDENRGSATAQAVAARAGLDSNQVDTAFRALRDAGLATEGPLRGGRITKLFRPTGEARRLAGSWPSADTAFERMIAALDEIAENSDDTDTRSRAQKIRAELVAGGKTLGLTVAGAILTGGIT